MASQSNVNNVDQEIRKRFYELLRQVISMDFDSSILSMMNQEKLDEYLQRISQLKIDSDRLWETIRSNDFPLSLQQIYTSIVQFRSQPHQPSSGRSLMADYTVTLWDCEQPIPLIIEEERNTSTVNENQTKVNDDNGKIILQKQTETSLSNSTYYSTNSEIDNQDDDDNEENFAVSICSTPNFHQHVETPNNESETISECELSSFYNSFHTFSTITNDDDDDESNTSEIVAKNDTFTGDNNSVVIISNAEEENKQTLSADNQSIDENNQQEKILESDSAILNNCTPSLMNDNNITGKLLVRMIFQMKFSSFSPIRFQ
ncbi:hypothetical protein BLA29_005004 [Euroglyphus maynei]|uniref:Uncharacterized protein n=1 Tax=Euroglyphus maynei TaxID=6958 RepID=A0A1Y3BI19_EURMA|nr:hypothetical protein BLA29_005004 [Euroglyphus maynei]